MFESFDHLTGYVHFFFSVRKVDEVREKQKRLIIFRKRKGRNFFITIHFVNLSRFLYFTNAIEIRLINSLILL